MNINIFVDINANQLVKTGFKVKCGISKLALHGTQMKAIYQVCRKSVSQSVSQSVSL